MSESGRTGEQHVVGPPRWVKIGAAITFVVIALFVALHLGGHGPGGHHHGVQGVPS